MLKWNKKVKKLSKNQITGRIKSLPVRARPRRITREDSELRALGSECLR